MIKHHDNRYVRLTNDQIQQIWHSNNLKEKKLIMLKHIRNFKVNTSIKMFLFKIKSIKTNKELDQLATNLWLHNNGLGV